MLAEEILEIWDKADIKGIVLPGSNDNGKKHCLLWVDHVILVGNSKEACTFLIIQFVCSYGSKLIFWLRLF